AGAETRSEHPIGEAIVAAARERGIVPGTVERFASRTGLGIEARVNGRDVVIGNAAFLAEHGIPQTGWNGTEGDPALASQTLVWAAVDGTPAGVLGIADTVRPTSRAAIQTLHDLGLRVAMITGDTEAAAEAIAAEVGIDDVRAGVRPEGKAQAIRAFQAQGHVVAMVGDGINDAPALAQADAGIAIGTGTDVAVETSDVTLMRDDLTAVAAAFRISGRTMQTIKQNLFFAFVYNVIGIPVAAGLLYPFFGILLSPMIASAAMALSSVSVITNSLRLHSSRIGAR
ncbi:MAG TPA: HAD-IC family P-type ATPase, partial [Rhodothermales bacterium]|nr:HAD-IC family P-type ATPase [Rhodothermales bacterium]